MRILLLGCGGIGGIVAAELARCGVDLDIVTGNRQIAQAIADRGLRVRNLDGSDWSVSAPHTPVERPEELTDRSRRYDIIFVGTKTTTLESAIGEVEPLLAKDGQVVLLQNGLPEERAEAIVGPERVIGCVVGWGATLLEPGYSARTSKGGMQLGRRFAWDFDPALDRLAQVLGRSFDTRIVPDFAGVRWSKLAINCATSTLGAAGGDTLGRLLRQRFVRRLALEIWAELVAVAKPTGVRLAKVAGTLDIEKLAITESERQLRLGSPGLFLKHSLLFGIGLKFRRMRSSMAVAIERGRRPEIDYLNGEIVRRGEALSIPTPVNRALVALIHDIVEKRARPGLNTLYDVYLQHCSGEPPKQLPPASFNRDPQDPSGRGVAPLPAQLQL